jgi:hypothetical protein
MLVVAEIFWAAIFWCSPTRPGCRLMALLALPPMEPKIFDIDATRRKSRSNGFEPSGD